MELIVLMTHFIAEDQSTSVSNDAVVIYIWKSLFEVGKHLLACRKCALLVMGSGNVVNVA